MNTPTPTPTPTQTETTTPETGGNGGGGTLGGQDGATDVGGSDGGSTGSGAGAGGGAAGSAPAASGGGSGAAEPCPDRIAPQSRILLRRHRGGRLRVSGDSSDLACGGARRGQVDRVAVSIALETSRRPARCACLRDDGSLSAPRSCLRTSYLPARGGRRWSFEIAAAPPAGRYRLWVRGVDVAGNIERKEKPDNFARLQVR